MKRLRVKYQFSGRFRDNENELFFKKKITNNKKRFIFLYFFLSSARIVPVVEQIINLKTRTERTPAAGSACRRNRLRAPVITRKWRFIIIFPRPEIAFGMLSRRTDPAARPLSRRGPRAR